MNKTRRLAGTLAAIALVTAACSSSDPAGTVAAGPANGDAVRVVIEDGKFVPDTVYVPANQTVTIEITNRDGDSHDFAVRSQQLNTGTLKSKGVATAVVVVGDEPIQFVCTFHGGMKGTIVPARSNGS